MLRQICFALSLCSIQFQVRVEAQTLEWRVDLGTTNGNVNQLYVADDYIFAQGSQSMIRLDLETGAINQHVELSLGSNQNQKQKTSPTSPTSPNSSSSPTSMIAYEKKSTTHYLLSSYDNGDLVAVDTRFGDVMWSVHHISSKPVIDWEYGVAVYMLTEAGKILAIDSMSGFLVWSIDVEGYTESDQLHLSLDNERLYVSSTDGQVQIYSALDGSHLASPYFEGMDSSFLVGDFLYFYRDDTIMVYYVNERVEAPLWSSKEMGELVEVLPMDDGKHVLLITSTGLHKVKRWSGKCKWNFQPTMDIVSVTTEGDAVYVVLELLEPTFLVKLDGKTGSKDWTFYVKGESIVGDVKVHDEFIYLLTSDETQASHLIKLDDSHSEMYQLQVGDLVYE
jgi:outer membrane protein assembly factor BamB